MLNGSALRSFWSSQYTRLLKNQKEQKRTNPKMTHILMHLFVKNHAERPWIIKNIKEDVAFHLGHLVVEKRTTVVIESWKQLLMEKLGSFIDPLDATDVTTK